MNIINVMIDFGYQVHKDNQIDLDNNNFRIINYIFEREPSLYTCIGCGSCSATCSVKNFSSFSFYKLHLLLRRGISENIKSIIGKCMFCGKCQMICPRGVNTRNAIQQIKIAINKYENHEI